MNCTKKHCNSGCLFGKCK